MARPYLLLHRRPYLRQSGPRWCPAARPLLKGATMSERRQHFLAEYDWIRTGADVRAARPRRDVGLDPLSADPRRLRRRHPVHRDVSGCLPMCGHGTIGTVTMALENGLVDAGDAGHAAARYAGRPRRWRATSRTARFVESVRITNVPPSSHAERARRSTSPGLGQLVFDVAYGGNFYAILEPQKNFRRPRRCRPADILRLEPEAARGRQRQDTIRRIPRTRPSTA